MQHNVQVTAAIFALIFSVSPQLRGQHDTIDTTRVPHNLADCLFRGRPQAGMWATCDVTIGMSPAEGTDGATGGHSVIMRSAIVPIEGIEDKEWLEVSIRRKAGHPPIYVAKLLVDRNSRATASDWWLSREACDGWEKRGTNEPTRFTSKTAKNTPMIGALLVSGDPDDRWAKLPATDVKTAAGEFRCSTFELRGKDRDDSGRLVCHLNPSVPFGFVRLTGQLRTTEEHGRVHIQLTGHGTDARSDLPEKTLEGLVHVAPAIRRKWTDDTGRHTVEAELVEFRDGVVRLRKSDGEVISVPSTRLSEADRQFLEPRAVPPAAPVGGDAPANPAVEPAVIVIGNQVIVKVALITMLETSFEDVERDVDGFSRVVEQDGARHAFLDDLGTRITFTSDVPGAASVIIQLAPDTKKDDLMPKHTFAGTVTIGATEINRQTHYPELRKRLSSPNYREKVLLTDKALGIMLKDLVVQIIKTADGQKVRRVIITASPPYFMKKMGASDSIEGR